MLHFNVWKLNLQPIGFPVSVSVCLFDQIWFSILLVFVGVNLMLNLMHSAAYGGCSLLKSIATIAQLHHLLNCVHCITNGEKTEEYVGGRLFQAVLEVRNLWTRINHPNSLRRAATQSSCICDCVFVIKAALC